MGLLDIYLSIYPPLNGRILIKIFWTTVYFNIAVFKRITVIFLNHDVINNYLTSV